MIPNDLGFGRVPYTWYKGFNPVTDDCPCSACTYERQRQRLEAHVRARGPSILVISDALTLTQNNSKEIIRIAPDGRLFWHGREVTTDEDFRRAMLELAARLVSR